MNGKLLFDIFYELLWFAIAAVAGYLLISPIRNEISEPFFHYLWASIFLVFTYFRLIAFMMRSLLLQNVFVKVGLFLLNIPLFFFVLNQYFKYIDVFDDYNYTLAANIFQHIRSGTEVADLLYIKKLTVFAGIASMMVIILLEARIVQAIFKLRQLDKYI
jgi:hypothetical protein